MCLPQYRLLQFVVIFAFLDFPFGYCPGQDSSPQRSSTEALAKENLPLGGRGIAANYPGDQGIRTDPAVIFAEDFEVDAIADFRQRWDTVRDPRTMSLSDLKPDASSGTKSLLISQVAEQGTGGDLYTRLPKGLDQTFARFYVRFARDCEPIHHFGTCLGGNQPATPWPQVKAGMPTAGDRAYWVGIEPFGEAWRWDYYVYWHQMRGSPPRYVFS